MKTKMTPLSGFASVFLAALLISSAPHAVAGNSWTSTNFGTACTASSSSPVPGQPGWTSCGIPDPSIQGFSTGSAAGTSYSSATIYDWNSSGLGIVGPGEPATGPGSTGPHAMDNYNGQEALVFRFSNGAVSLTGLTIGWNGHDNTTTTNGVNYNDSDLSIYAWTGAAVDPTLQANFGPASAGWSLIGNYLNVGTLTNNTAIINTATYSSYWLVAPKGAGSAASTDAFKVLAVAGKGCTQTVSGNACVPGGGTPSTGVPEPGSLALLTAGLLGMVTIRRRQRKGN